MQELLLISYNYPPANTPGVFRVCGFVNYFPRYGYQPRVLTSSNPAGADLDPGLTAFIRVPCPVERTRDLQPLDALARAWAALRRFWSQPAADAGGGGHLAPRTPPGAPVGFAGGVKELLSFPDSKVGWVPAAIVRGWRLVKKHRIRYVLVTSPPHSAQLVGLCIKKLRPEVVLLSDFRDPWSGNVVRQTERSPWLSRLAARLESAVLNSSDCIIANTERNAADLRAAFPSVDPAKVLTITNGFDPLDFSGLLPRRAPASPGALSCVFVGTLYDGMSDGLLRALSKMRRGNPDLHQKIHFTFVGYADEREAEKITAEEFSELVSYLGSVPYQESLEFMLGADLLLYLLPNDPRTSYCIPSKLFNYMVARRPVMAILPEGEASAIIRQHGLGHIFDPSDTNGIVDFFQRLAAEGAESVGALGSADAGNVEYSREAQVGAIAAHLDKLSARQRRRESV